ncbi:uncharacterized protein LOC123529415 [Mercenaria mercenaria]|uniref:uncharacterized protein LOC123529415 n=1 Tax=Mercenaria mercenaria TaxID=6596 RepID=UPI00234E8E87|nr:uncharacterized protein LOC123529415 [Mercenaria mercenaria]
MKSSIFILVQLLIEACCQGNQRPQVQPTEEASDCICIPYEPLCKCTFTVEHRLTMIFNEKELVEPYNGNLRIRGSQGGRILTDDEEAQVNTADGEVSRLVIAINGKFPGPRVDVFENQEIEITVVNTFHTDSVTVHFHGIHQKNTPWMDGVASVTQCPILLQTFVYRFRAYPPGTSFYHAHIGDQRSMGLYGPFIVRKRNADLINEVIVSLQDWNHLMDAETAYMRMITEQFDFNTGQKIPTTFSVDRAQFSRFEFQSGLVNGKGRFWRDRRNHNGAPLERFKVQTGRLYRFRIIGAMTLYPMRVYVENNRLQLRSSDCFNLQNVTVQSIIVHPGERYDFNLRFDRVTKKEYLLVAETIETPGSHNILTALDHQTQNPPNNKYEYCTRQNPCMEFNCPYGNPGTNTRFCLNFNDVRNTDPYRNPSRVIGNRVDNEYFFNFAFPGFTYTPGSVNGREFEPPASPLLTQSELLSTSCDEATCQRNGICKCTYIVEVPGDELIQMTFMNIGNGSGWSHPIHLHGQSFFVMKMGLGTYNQVNGRLIDETNDIRCEDRYGFCTEVEWQNRTWIGGNIPGQNVYPPLKDTIVVPTGGYVVVRFISDNPGMWFLHCHIDLHNTNGMGMVINASPGNHPKPPVGFPTCGNFLYNGKYIYRL